MPERPINTIAIDRCVNRMNSDNSDSTIRCDANAMSGDCHVNAPVSDHPGKLQCGPVEQISVMTTTHINTEPVDGRVLEFHMARNAFGQWKVSGGDIEMPYVRFDDLKRFLEAALLMVSGQEACNHTQD